MPPPIHSSRRPPHRRSATRRAGSGPGLGLVTVTLVAIAALAMPASATIRDVEVAPAPDAPPGVAVAPVVELARNVDGAMAWTVVITNGGPVPGTFDLAVRELEPGADGMPRPGDLVDWAVLPRDRVDVDVGQAAHFEVLLTPPPAALPAAVALVATTPGEDAREVRATLVLWPAGHEPDIAAALAEDGVLRLTADGPAPVDVSIATRAFPGRGGTTSIGPLVLLGGSRDVPFEAVSSPFGQATSAVVAIDGIEVARAEAEARNWPARLLALAAGSLVAVAALLATRRLRSSSA